MPPKKAAVQDVEEAPKVRQAKQISMLEHAKKKSMWSGSKNVQTQESYVYDEKEKIFNIVDLKYPPALLKIIDETIVNAIDHHSHYPKLVTEIRIQLSEAGEISVYNNGPGIPVEKTQNLNGVEMYTPQLIASEFLAGDNLDDEGSNVKGGTNGIGLKLAAAFSTILTLETVDGKTQKHYIQNFRDELQTIDPPEIKSVAKTVKPFTRISFIPNYAEFKLDIAKFRPTLFKLLQTRSWQAAAYTSATVFFNDSAIRLESFEQFSQMFNENLVFATQMVKSNKPKEYPWEVCFAVSDGKERHMSIVNGVYMPKGGTHIQYIQNQLVANLREYVEKEIKKSGVKFNKNYITNNVFIFMKGPVPSPEFLSQTKEAISDPIEKFSSYEISAVDWRRIWTLLEPAILAAFLKKQLGDVKTRANRGKVDVPKYKEARLCRDAKRCHECGLIVTEGDSASGTADKGLLNKKIPDFTYDLFGVFSIGGVPMNGFKESLELKRKSKTDADIPHPKPRLRKPTGDTDTESETRSEISDADLGDFDRIVGREPKPTVIIKPKRVIRGRASDDMDLPPRRIPNKKLINNERISSLIKVLGLDFNKTYAFTEIGDKEYKTLRYGYVLGLTDQDLDGFNIYGLLATLIMTYWPALLRRGFLRRINTPVIRVYPKNTKTHQVESFYSEKQAYDWMATLSTEEKKKYNSFEFYKGLGSHDDDRKEIMQMFMNISSKIKTYVCDPDSYKNMLIYYGDDTSPRKIALADPTMAEPIEGLVVPMSQQFCIDTKSYQRDNIIRKLLSSVDGFVSSRRKVFYVARQNGRNKIKVAGLAGKAVADANYHHSESSIEQTIVRMAQSYPMARNLPLLIPKGNFGSRSKGYKDFAASRYIFTHLNWRLADKLFRREDEFILEYVVDDGERYEPKYYVPIIPYVLCEDNQLPATGWKISIYARDIKAIFKNVRAMINGTIDTCGKLPPWCKDFKGKIKTYKNRNYYVGVYNYNADDNTVHISELPPGMFSNSYLRGSDDDKIKRKKEEKKGIQIKEWVEDFEDNTTTESVDITITLKPGAYDAITADGSKYGNETFDPFEDYFELKEPIYHLINLVNEKHEVVEYESYEAVFNDWFKFRKDLYAVRVEREIILTNLEIKMLRNMQRFSKEHDKYNITSKTSEEHANEIIRKAKYDMFNHVILENPKFTDVKLLIDIITLEKYGACYEYILRMSYRDLTENAYEKRERQINKLMDRKKYLEATDSLFVGAKIWILELEELEDAINKGLASGWSYGENDHTFAS